MNVAPYDWNYVSKWGIVPKRKLCEFSGLIPADPFPTNPTHQFCDAPFNLPRRGSIRSDEGKPGYPGEKWKLAERAQQEFGYVSPYRARTDALQWSTGRCQG